MIIPPMIFTDSKTETLFQNNKVPHYFTRYQQRNLTVLSRLDPPLLKQALNTLPEQVSELKLRIKKNPTTLDLLKKIFLKTLLV